MNKFKHIIIILIAFTAITSYAQKVSNITFKQEQSNIIVSYDLETKTPCKVSLYVSTNGGVKWQGPLTKVTGDVGDKIISGSHNITWNVLEEFQELKGDNIKFQVKAISNEIETVTIGNQVWMKKNLDVSTYRNGDIIPEVKNLADWRNMKIGAWCYYNFDTKNGKIYGKLYNWFAVLDPRGLAPEGYHIPFYEDFSKLTDFLGGKALAGGKLKQKGITLWKSPNNYCSTDEFGFAAIPGGQLKVDTEGRVLSQSKTEITWEDISYFFTGIGESAMFWSISKYLSKYSEYYFELFHDTPKIYGSMSNIHEGLSVRCLKD